MEKPMLKLMDLLTEGVYDKGIFKAVFMAGGPGSGKTFMAGQLFGIPGYKKDGKFTGTKQSYSVGGLKTVNSDKEFMGNMDIKIFKRSRNIMPQHQTKT